MALLPRLHSAYTSNRTEQLTPWSSYEITWRLSIWAWITLFKINFSYSTHFLANLFSLVQSKSPPCVRTNLDYSSAASVSVTVNEAVMSRGYRPLHRA